MKTNDITIEALHAYRDQLMVRVSVIDEELVRLQDGTQRVVPMPKTSQRRTRKKMSAEARRKLSLTLKRKWAERKAAATTPTTVNAKSA
jgi:hypothetical protein